MRRKKLRGYYRICSRIRSDIYNSRDVLKYTSIYYLCKSLEFNINRGDAEYLLTDTFTKLNEYIYGSFSMSNKALGIIHKYSPDKFNEVLNDILNHKYKVGSDEYYEMVNVKLDDQQIQELSDLARIFISKYGNILESIKSNTDKLSEDFSKYK